MKKYIYFLKDAARIAFEITVVAVLVTVVIVSTEISFIYMQKAFQ